MMAGGAGANIFVPSASAAPLAPEGGGEMLWMERGGMRMRTGGGETLARRRVSKRSAGSWGGGPRMTAPHAAHAFASATQVGGGSGGATMSGGNTGGVGWEAVGFAAVAAVAGGPAQESRGADDGGFMSGGGMDGGSTGGGGVGHGTFVGGGTGAGGMGGGTQAPWRVLQGQRTRSHDRNSREGVDVMAVMRRELEELRAASRLDAQRIFAVRTRYVGALIGAQAERVTAIVELAIEAVAATNASSSGAKTSFMWLWKNWPGKWRS